MAFANWLKPRKRKKQVESTWYVYILLCADGTYYTGVTVNVHGRVWAHNHGQAAKYTRSRRPVQLLGQSRGLGKREAHRAEYRLKQLPRDQKLAALAKLQ